MLAHDERQEKSCQLAGRDRGRNREKERVLRRRSDRGKRPNILYVRNGRERRDTENMEVKSVAARSELESTILSGIAQCRDLHIERRPTTCCPSDESK